MRIPASGSAAPEAIVAGLYQKGTTTWSYFIRQPVPSPDGSSLAFVSDGPDATKSDVVLQFYDLATGTMTSAGLAENRPLGHQDPAWSPDGATLLYVKDGRDGARGAPTIMRYNVATKKASVLAGPGYLAPAWSADGRFVAATRTDAFGTDVVVLDAKTGVELLRVTNDGRSFSPVWSPFGDALAYLRIDRGVVDLVLVHLGGTAPDWTIGETLPLTSAAGLDAGSRPGWFVPPELLPTPPPSPTPVEPSPTASGSPTPGGSPAASATP
jgi:Tol biopolymer transport system component